MTGVITAGGHAFLAGRLIATTTARRYSALNHSIRLVLRWPRRAWPPGVRAGAAMATYRRAWQLRPIRRAGPVVTTLAAAAIVAGGCSHGSSGPGVANVGSPSAGGSSLPGGSASNGPLAFSQCMRSHGVPNFPDPDSNGSISKETAQQLGVSNSQYQAATSACGDLLPNSDQGGLSQAEIQQAWSGSRNFAGCMRSHGVSNWPDPADDGIGSPIFYLQNKIDANAPQIFTEIHACAHLIPPEDRSFGGSPGGVRMCPGDKPNPATQRGACR